MKKCIEYSVDIQNAVFPWSVDNQNALCPFYMQKAVCPLQMLISCCGGCVLEVMFSVVD